MCSAQSTAVTEPIRCMFSLRTTSSGMNLIGSWSTARYSRPRSRSIQTSSPASSLHPTTLQRNSCRGLFRSVSEATTLTGSPKTPALTPAASEMSSAFSSSLSTEISSRGLVVSLRAWFYLSCAYAARLHLALSACECGRVRVLSLSLSLSRALGFLFWLPCSRAPFALLPPPPPPATHTRARAHTYYQRPCLEP